MKTILFKLYMFLLRCKRRTITSSPAILTGQAVANEEEWEVALFISVDFSQRIVAFVQLLLALATLF